MVTSSYAVTLYCIEPLNLSKFFKNIHLNTFRQNAMPDGKLPDNIVKMFLN